MKRFTILSLMGVVLSLAVALAALRGANEHWSGGLLLATPLLLCTALVGGLFGRESARARRIGFAVFGTAYFALTSIVPNDGSRAKLPTSKLLWLIHERVSGAQTRLRVWTSVGATSYGGITYFDAIGNSGSVVPQPGSTVSPTGPGQPVAAEVALFQDISTAVTPPNRWRVMLPGALNFDAFQTVGHCLFALLAGLLGAFIAGRFQRKAETT